MMKQTTFFEPDSGKLDSLLEWYKEIVGDDRMTVIIGAQKLDDTLVAMLSKAMGIDRTDDLFDFTGPLGTFSSRIMFAKKLGYITDEFASLLTIIRRLRNDVAHSPKQLDLNEPPSADRILALRRLVEKSPLWDGFNDRLGPSSSHNLLVRTFVIATMNLSVTAHETSRLQPEFVCSMDLLHLPSKP